MIKNNSVVKEWMKTLLLTQGFNIVYKDFYEQFKSDVPESTSNLKTFCDTMTRTKRQLEELGITKLENPDDEIVEENIRLAKLSQKQMDLNRIKNKSFREAARTENNIEEYTKALTDELKKIDISKILNKDLKPFSDNEEYYGVINISDTHFNEIITPMEGMNNSYDFRIASSRLRLLAEKSKKIFKAYGIKNILITLQGDIINSNRRNEELLASSTNRSKATLLATILFEQFILDFNKDFSINISCVTGNESRLDFIHAWSDILATENFDFTIFNILKLIFRDSKSIHFLEGDFKEQVISLNGFNILILHGENIKTEKDVQMLIGKYLSQGTSIDHVMSGHLHSAKISDYSSRSSSLCGSNAYSSRALGLISKASQNIHIINSKLKLIDSMKCDLQIIDSTIGYNIEESLIAYNAKSLEKTIAKKTILEIKI